MTFCANAEEQSQPDVGAPMMTTQDETATATCSCEEEIRRCDQLLVGKDKSCADARRESSQQCEIGLQASMDASARAHEADVKKLTAQLQQDASKDCDRLVSESYTRGRQEAETRCDEQLTANQEANQQSRTAHQAEVKYWTSVIDKMREEHAGCERQVSESYTRGRQEMEVMYEQQLETSMEAMAESRTAHQAEVHKLTSMINQMQEEQHSIHSDCDHRVAESYTLGWQEVEVQYESQLESSMEAMAQVRAAHENEIQGLTSIINQSREQMEAVQTDCERQVSEAYTRGWREVEVQYEEQLVASKDAMVQARAEHEKEIQRLTAVINQIRKQEEAAHTDCERRLTESYSIGLVQAQATTQKQMDQAERQLSSLKISAQLRIEYLAKEKARLDRENRDFYQSLSRAQRLLLEAQRELAEAHAQLEAKWMIHRTWDGVVGLGAQAWESFLAERVKVAWDSFGRKLWERYGAPVWQLVHIVRVKFEINSFLMAGVVADVIKTIYTEIRLFIRDLPETLPQVMEDIRKALDFLRVEAMKLFHQATQYLWGQVLAATSAAHAKIAPMFHRFVKELYLEKFEPHIREFEPHIQAVKRQMDIIHESLSPYLEQLNRSWENLKKEFGGLLQRIKQDSFEMLNQVYSYGKDRLRSMDDWKDELVKDFGLAARTMFLVLQVYAAPKFILDPVEHCHQQPEVALWSILKFSVGLVGLWLARRLIFPVKRKHLPRRKVKFAVTK